MSDDGSADDEHADENAAGDVPDETVREMVRHLEPTWRVDSIERSEYGTDFVAFVDVRTPRGDRSAVLKATTAEWVAPETAGAEPRLLSLVDRETTIPVPEVLGYRDQHGEYPAPFYLMSREPGENYEGRRQELSPSARERIVREAGRNLAELHELGPLSRVGRVGVRDGELSVLDTEDSPSDDDFHEWLLASCEKTLDGVEEGGYFSELADDPNRFSDLVPELRRHLRETIPTLPEPAPPTYCNNDYRYGNLLIDPETGAARAVLDWGVVLSGAPAFNLASAESLLLRPDLDDADRGDELRGTLRSAYADARDGWSFDEATRERMRTYRLACLVDELACFPLWNSPPERDDREAVLRDLLGRYV